MTIPELEADIRALRDGMNQLNDDKDRLTSDLAELRTQLGLERIPRDCVSTSAGCEQPVNKLPPRRF